MIEGFERLDDSSFGVEVANFLAKRCDFAGEEAVSLILTLIFTFFSVKSCACWKETVMVLWIVVKFSS